MPSSVARTLKSRKSGIITVIVHTLRYQVGAQTVTGINEVCNRYGYGTMVCCSENDPAKELQAIQLCLNQQVEGFVIVPAVESIEPYQAICEKGTPVVLCTRNLPGWPYGSVYVRHERNRDYCHGRPDGDTGAGGNRRIAPRRTGTMRWAGRSWSIREFPQFTSRCVKWAFRQGKRSLRHCKWNDESGD